MNNRIVCIFSAVMMLIFIAEKLCFTAAFENSTDTFNYLSVTLPQLAVLIGCFVGEHFLIKFSQFEWAKFIGGFKYAVVLLLYFCNIGWSAWEFMTFFYTFMWLFLLWYPIGMIAEPILIGQLEKRVCKLKTSTK